MIDIEDKTDVKAEQQRDRFEQWYCGHTGTCAEWLRAARNGPRYEGSATLNASWASWWGCAQWES